MLKIRNFHYIMDQTPKYCETVRSFSNRPTYFPNKLTKRTLWGSANNNKNKFGKYDVIKKPGKVSDSLCVPDFINRPPYHLSGQPPPPPKLIEVKSHLEVDKMAQSCRLARMTLDKVAASLYIGMTTEDIDAIVHEMIINLESYPSTLNYLGFPKSTCTSVNNIACHGIPDNRILQDGDILSVDITLYNDGYHGDCCDTFLLGNVDDQGKQLVEAAKKCRDGAIAICGPGVPFQAIGEEITKIAKEENVTVVPAFIGHGIGKYFHGPPDIYHCVNKYPGTMQPGMTFTIEPVVAQGDKSVVILEDGWTVVMEDEGRAAQFEHTIVITEEGHNILTKYL